MSDLKINNITNRGGDGGPVIAGVSTVSSSAFIIMPNKNHKESRSLFVNEAKKLYQKEFKKWFQLTTELVPLLKFFRQIEIKIPTYYIMGDQDYMFLPSVKNLVKVHNKSELHVIQNCGHVVNIDKPEIFNKRMLDFLERSI